MKHIVFVFNVPAFYKINLIKELAKYHRVTMIILGTTNQVVLDKSTCIPNTDIISLSNDDMDEKWSGILRAFKLRKIIRTLKYDYIVYNGWDNAELCLNCYLTPKNKNCLISESSVYESSTKGIKAWIKKQIIKRFSYAFVSGIPHVHLMNQLGFKGEIEITGGVGINSPLNKKISSPNCPIRYLYIGRLIELKNVRFLIDIFNRTRKSLTIVGDGPLREELELRANDNITFLGFQSHDKINDLLHSHDCLVLPSLQEPWGLVVEEALKTGIPVIASNRVGSSIDLIQNYEAGILIDPENPKSFETAMRILEEKYDYYAKNAKSINFIERDDNYVKAFNKVFSK